MRLSPLMFACVTALVWSLVTGHPAIAQTEAQVRSPLRWSKLPDVPPAPGESKQWGLAGPFTGVHDDALIVAGGANFPKGVPWHKAADGSGWPLKIYHDTIYVLVKVKPDDGGQAERSADGIDIKDAQQYKWIETDVKLDHVAAYGVSIPTADGLICIGGEWRKDKNDKATGEVIKDRGLLTDVFVLKWHKKTEKHPQKLEKTKKLIRKNDKAEEIHDLPPLPEATSNMAGALVGDVIYIAGGTTSDGATDNFWALDLSKRKKKKDANDKPIEFKWEKLPTWPGPPRSHAIGVAQSDGATDCFYLFSGRYKKKDDPYQIFTDAYRFNPKQYKKEYKTAKAIFEAKNGAENAKDFEFHPGPHSKFWKRRADIAPDGESPRCVMAGTGIKSGVHHILIFGGAAGQVFLEVEQVISDQIKKAEKAGDSEKVKQLEEKKADLYDNHSGFSRDILAYHTITDTWVKVGQLPEGSPVTTTAVQWGKDKATDKAIVIPSGEIKPGVRTATVWLGKFSKSDRGFGALNWTVLGVYMAALVAMGFYFSTRIHDTDDFFKAGQRIPWWAAGISIFGTMLSAITFMGIPAKSFATDWTYFIANMAIVAVAPIIVIWFLPFYRRLNVTTAYEYLEKRFNLAARLIGSVMFMFFQLGRIGIVLYLPSIALSVVTGMDINVCILLMGLLCILYTVLGGIEAVIWTDVLQVFVLAGGAIVCLCLITMRVDGGWNSMIDIADASGKLHLLNFHFSLAEGTFLVLLIGGMGLNLITYGTDQTVIQRYLTTKDEREATKAIWTNGILVIPASLLFFGIGTALFAFYKTHPASLDPTLMESDAIFPLFIVMQLPAGVAGLMIAAVFAASMSSLDSSMNSVATAFTTDFFRRFKSDASEKTCLLLARWITVIIGALGTGLALWMAAQPGAKSLWDEYFRYIGLFGGGLAGLFLLAMFTRRANAPGALVGIFVSGIVQFILHQWYELHVLVYPITGIVSCLVIGYVASLLIPASPKDLADLTIHTKIQLKN